MVWFFDFSFCDITQYTTGFHKKCMHMHRMRIICFYLTNEMSLPSRSCTKKQRLGWLVGRGRLCKENERGWPGGSSGALAKTAAGEARQEDIQ